MTYWYSLTNRTWSISAYQHDSQFCFIFWVIFSFTWLLSSPVLRAILKMIPLMWPVWQFSSWLGRHRSCLLIPWRKHSNVCCIMWWFLVLKILWELDYLLTPWETFHSFCTEMPAWQLGCLLWQQWYFFHPEAPYNPRLSVLLQKLYLQILDSLLYHPG